MSSHRSRRAASRASRASSPSRRPSSDPPSAKSPVPEILTNLGRVALPFVIRKLNEKQAGGASSSSKRDTSHRRDKRSRSRTSPRARSRSRSRSQTGASTVRKRDGESDRDSDRDRDIHSLVSQVAVGLLAVGVRQVIKRRKEAKLAAAAAAASASASSGPSSAGQNGQYKQRTDPELSGALEYTARELQGATESIRRLSRTPGHKGRCEVRDELVKDAERLENTLEGLQIGIHNMRNLHPGLEPPRRPEPERPRTRPRFRDRSIGRGRP